MNRLYQVESNLTVTGGMADHRLRLPSSRMAAVAAHLAESLGVENAKADPEVGDAIADHLEWINTCAEDLAAQLDIAALNNVNQGYLVEWEVSEAYPEPPIPGE